MKDNSRTTVNSMVRWYEAALVLLFSAALAFTVVFCQAPSTDEGNYLYTSKLLFQGFKPYQDFFYDKLPLLLIVYGLPQKVLSGLFVGRITGALFFLASVYLVIRIGEKLGGRRAGIIAGLVYGTKLFNLVGNCLVFTYAPATFFFCLSLYFFFVSDNSRRWLLAVLFWSLATQIRQIYLAALPFLLILEWKRDRRSVPRILTETLAVTIVSALYLIPFFYQDFKPAFNNLYTHYLNVRLEGGISFLSSKLYWLEISLKEFYPELIIGALLLSSHFITRKGKNFWRHPQTTLGAMSVLLIAVSLKAHYSYAIHNLVAAPLFALLIGGAVEQVWRKSAKAGYALTGLMALLLAGHAYPYLARYAAVGRRFAADTQILERKINQITDQGDTVLSFNSYLILNTKVREHPNFTYSLESLAPAYNKEECEKLRLANPDLLVNILKNGEVKLIEINDTSMRRLSLILGNEWFMKFTDAVRNHYSLKFSYQDIHNPNGLFYLFSLKR